MHISEEMYTETIRLCAVFIGRDSKTHGGDKQVVPEEAIAMVADSSRRDSQEM